MEDKVATEIKQQWGQLDADSSEMMNLYQEVADHFFPRENSITSQRPVGEDKSLPILDPTGMLALQDMVSGLYSAIIPTGNPFFRLLAQDPPLNDQFEVAAYLNRLTNLVHSELLRSNFVTEFCEYLTSLVGFGTGCMYSGWDKQGLGLTFKDWDVSNYRFSVGHDGKPNMVMIKWQYTAQQAYERYGEEAGRSVVECARDEKRGREKFSFIWRVQKRKDRDASKQDSGNYPWEEICINEKDGVVVQQRGYRRFPYHISRWNLSSNEVWGRGQGTVSLSADKELQRQRRSLLLCADLANNPPREVLSSFEGTPRVFPGAVNHVMERNSIVALDRTLQGNFPITVETIKMQQEIIHYCFFRHVFAPLQGVEGTHRTTLEIYERTKEGYVRLILPVSRLYYEGLAGLIENATLLCVENHLIEPPPPQLGSLKIDYLGRLALAIQEQQVDAFQRYAQFAATMEPLVPGFVRKTISIERAGRRMASTFGMNEGDLVTPEERAAIEAEEAAEKQQMQMAMAMQTAGDAYQKGTKAPEPGSPAEALVGAGA